MARQRNVRVEILSDLRIVNRWMRWAVAEFRQTPKIYPSESGDGDIRARRPEEYRENQPEKLLEFAAGARKAAEALIIIAEKAEDRAYEIGEVL